MTIPRVDGAPCRVSGARRRHAKATPFGGIRNRPEVEGVGGATDHPSHHMSGFASARTL